MTTQIKPKSHPASMATVAVLPTARDKTNAYLDAAAALDLAILGATACRMTPLARLIDTVWCLTGGGWRPPQDVVHDALRRANAAGTVLATESWIRSIPFFYTLTPKGAKLFRTLMRRPLPSWDDPISRSAAAIKFGLLDVTEDRDLVAIAADLKRFYLDSRLGLEARRESLAEDRVFLHTAVGERIAWADQRIHALDDLIRLRLHRPVIH
tara:strand:- start:40 stop:672 length:633 start_codon:yes stop_codon:yes gene_type:complete